ncbi:MAG: hypothetical protein AAB521_03585 [Patescibacteria group bacterium]
MPEIDLIDQKNRDAFLEWRSKKLRYDKGKEKGEGELNTGEYVYTDSIEGEPVNTFTAAGSRDTLPEGFLRAEVSEKHAGELKKAGVIFDAATVPHSTSEEIKSSDADPRIM